MADEIKMARAKAVYEQLCTALEHRNWTFDKVEEDGCIHDTYRIDYHRAHIQNLKEAVEEGVDIFVECCLILASVLSPILKVLVELCHHVLVSLADVVV